MDNILIECVWYKSKREFNKFIKTIEEPEYTVIDYLIIKNKLFNKTNHNNNYKYNN